jgi:hypothetical protein
VTEFQRPEHTVIASLLRDLDHDILMECRCWFGGGTAIVLTHGEYRRSLDIDFLCADRDGYRQLRSRFLEGKDGALFPSTVRLLREPVADTYGIRALLEVQGLVLKFEIVREGRIDLTGSRHAQLHVPTLSLDDMFAEKLLAMRTDVTIGRSPIAMRWISGVSSVCMGTFHRQRGPRPRRLTVLTSGASSGVLSAISTSTRAR